MFFISSTVREFSNAMISTPQDWVITEYRVVNKHHPSLNLWIGNGLLFYDISNVVKLNLVEKFYMKWAINKFMAARIKYYCGVNKE